MNRGPVLRKSRPNTTINVGEELLSLLHGNTHGEELESRMQQYDMLFFIFYFCTSPPSSCYPQGC